MQNFTPLFNKINNLILGNSKIMSGKSKNQKKDFFILVALIVVLWQVLSMFYSPLIIPGPVITFKPLLRIILERDFLINVYITTSRLVIGIFWSVLGGLVIGIFMGNNQRIKNLLKPLIYFIQSIPPILYLTLAMIWFGLDGGATSFIVFIACLPIMIINICEGFENIDVKLVEMGRSFKFSRWKMLSTIIIPSLQSYFRSGFIIVTALGWKLVIMGEVLSASVGIGAKLTDARANLQTNEVFAWGIILILISYSSQKLIVLFFDLSEKLGRKQYAIKTGKYS